MNGIPINRRDLQDFNIGLTQDIEYINQQLRNNAFALLKGESVTIPLASLNSEPVIEAFTDFNVKHEFHRNESYLIFKLK